MSMANIFFILSNALATSLIDYQFNQNFGQIFTDYSSNSNYGVNGALSTSASKDTIPTDRGAYFPDCESYITLPKNDVATSNFYFGSTFTMYLWILPLDSCSYYIFYRSCAACNNYFYLARNHSTGSLIARVVYGSYDTGVHTSSSNSVPGRNTYLVTWALVFVNFNPYTASVGIFQNTPLKIRSPFL